jgi:recombination protein RecA
MQRADGSKLLAKFCRKVCNVVPVNRCIIVGITHIMSNVSGYGSPWQEKSGQALMYQSDVKLKCTSFRPWLVTKEGPQIGQEVDWTAVNTALYIPPGQKTTSYIRYGIGIDKIRELLNIGIDLGVIVRGGAWYSFPMFKNEKAQGLDNAQKLVESTPDGYNIVYNEIKKILGITI